MQSEYPLSVLIVVPPWPGPVEQNPEPTTPTGPPRPAAAAAATLSRYQGYIERSAEYRNVFLPDLLSSETWRAASSKRISLTPGHRHVPVSSLSLGFFSLSGYFSAIRTRHAGRDIHLTADDITAPRTARGIVAVHAALALAHNDNASPRPSIARR